MVLYGHVWYYMVFYSHVWFVWLPMVLCGLYLSYMFVDGHVQFCIVQYDPAWSCVVMYGPVKSCLVLYSFIRSGIVMYSL